MRGPRCGPEFGGARYRIAGRELRGLGEKGERNGSDGDEQRDEAKDLGLESALLLDILRII